MTLEEAKKNIEEKLGGYQIAPATIRDYIENPGEFTEDYTPTMWLFNFTEIEMPEEELDSIYCIPLVKEKKLAETAERSKASKVKEGLVFLGTKDGITRDYMWTIFPNEISQSEIKRVYDKILNRA